MSSDDDHKEGSSEEGLSCWVISDGRKGIENQALGLAEAASKLRKLSVDTHTLTSGRAFKAAAPLMQFAIKSNLKDYKLPLRTPDLAIGCGRQAIAPLLALKKQIQGVSRSMSKTPKLIATGLILSLPLSMTN